jgi:DNA-binding transcriptional ArsR family regulator
MSAEIRVIKDPEVAKLLADETRRKMLHMLRHREMSSSDLAKALDKPHSSIQHHLTLLREADLVEETRSERVRNMIQPFYRSKAQRIIISYSLSEALAEYEGIRTWKQESRRKLLDALQIIGIDIPKGDYERVEALLELCTEREKLAFEESLERASSPELEKHARMSLVHLLTHINLSKDREHARAIGELEKLTK